MAIITIIADSLVPLMTLILAQVLVCLTYLVLLKTRIKNEVFH